MPNKKSPRATKSLRPRAARATGRPTTSLENLRERVLDSALLAYAQVGPAATRSKDVARIAGVAPALVNYYFKGREGLLSTVLKERLDPVTERIWAPVLDASLPEDRMLERMVHELIMVAREYRWFSPLWIRDLLTGRGTLMEHSDSVRSGNEIGLLQQRIRAGQKKGLIPESLNADLLLWSIMGLVVFPFAFYSALRVGKEGKADLFKERKSHTEELLRRALKVERKPDRQAAAE